MLGYLSTVDIGFLFLLGCKMIRNLVSRVRSHLSGNPDVELENPYLSEEDVYKILKLKCR